MGLIEKAIMGAAAKAESGAQERVFSLGEGLPFDLNLTTLKAKGVYTPAVRDEPQAFELRAVKRRLLRRIGYLQRAGRDRRLAAGRNRNLVLFTSTRPGEGKSFAAVNLAMSLVQEDAIPVVLIDGDPSRPRVRTYFDLPAGKGLTDVLKDPSLPLAAASRNARDVPLTVIGEGLLTPNTTELFGSNEAKRFFTSLSMICAEGVIIVDAPPMLATTETIALARHADEVVFLVEADSTPQPAVAIALDELLELNPNVSLVLNRCLIPAGGSHYAAYEYYEKRTAENGKPPSGERDRG